MKKCKKCGIEKEYGEFYKKKNSKDGRENKCKECKKEDSYRHIKICPVCKKEFKTSKIKQEHCSKSCRGINDTKKTEVKCSVCKTKIMKTPKEIERSKNHYCSNDCRSVGVKLNQSGRNNPNFKNKTLIVKCKNCSKDFVILECNLKNINGKYKKNLYCSNKCKALHQKIILRNNKNPNFRNSKKIILCSYCSKSYKKRIDKITANNYCSNECKALHQKVLLTGTNNPNYLHGLSEKIRNERRMIDGYSYWREQVFMRDSYKCQICNGDKTLNAHHLNGYNWFIEGRTDIRNGVTLCVDCHNKFHNIYGRGNNTKEQFEEYINNIKNNIIL